MIVMSAVQKAATFTFLKNSFSRYREDNEKFPRRGRRVGGGKLGTRSKRRDESLDIGNILKNTAESLMQPAKGMEEQAAR